MDSHILNHLLSCVVLPFSLCLSLLFFFQLFDFGFARELPEPPPQVHVPNDPYRGLKQEDTLYHMSGKGTLLYMAAEVLGTRCYNQKVRFKIFLSFVKRCHQQNDHWSSNGKLNNFLSLPSTLHL